MCACVCTPFFLCLQAMWKCCNVKVGALFMHLAISIRIQKWKKKNSIHHAMFWMVNASTSCRALHSVAIHSHTYLQSTSIFLFILLFSRRLLLHFNVTVLHFFSVRFFYKFSVFFSLSFSSLYFPSSVIVLRHSSSHKFDH